MVKSQEKENDKTAEASESAAGKGGGDQIAELEKKIEDGSITDEERKTLASLQREKAYGGTAGGT